MQTFDPEALDIQLIEIDGQLIPDTAKLQYLVSAKQIKVAYYRIPPEFRDFLKTVHDNAKIVGFQYDFEEDDLNFGILVKNDENYHLTESDTESDAESSDEDK